jgi:hypothetical protein
LSTATTDSRSSRLRHRRRQRIGLLTAFAILASALVTTVTASAATANDANGCPDASTAGNFQTTVTGFRFPDGHNHANALLVFWIESKTPRFRPVESRVVTNDLSTPSTATFTSQQSQAFTITDSVSTGVDLTTMETVFKTTVSASVTQSRTTSLGVSATATVPAFGRVQGDYGLETFDVTWTVDIYQKDSKCWYHGSFRHVTSNLPTTIEGWILHS